MAHTRTIAKIVDFFRGGYPTDLPRTGYVPALALLTRRLSEEDVLVIAKAITDAGPVISQKDIHSALTDHLGEAPLSEHVDRLVHELTDTGWLVVDASGRAVGPALPNQLPETRNRFLT